MSGIVVAAKATRCRVSSGLFGSTVALDANTAPANFPAPYNKDIIGNTNSSPRNIFIHFLNKSSVFGSSHAAKAIGDMDINSMIPACLTTRIINTVIIAKNPAARVGIPIAKAANAATPPTPTMVAAMALPHPAASDSVPIPPAPASKASFNVCPNILDKSTKI